MSTSNILLFVNFSEYKAAGNSIQTSLFFILKSLLSHISHTAISCGAITFSTHGGFTHLTFMPHWVKPLSLSSSSPYFQNLLYLESVSQTLILFLNVFIYLFFAVHYLFFSCYFREKKGQKVPEQNFG